MNGQYLKSGLHYAIYYILCVGNSLMDKILLHISLTKLKKKLKNKQNIKSLVSDFKNYVCKALTLYLAFTFRTLSVYVWLIV